jgi:hypothetical protein
MAEKLYIIKQIAFINLCQRDKHIRKYKPRLGAVLFSSMVIWQSIPLYIFKASVIWVVFTGVVTVVFSGRLELDTFAPHSS